MKAIERCGGVSDFRFNWHGERSAILKLNLRERAEIRIAGEPRLQPYRDVLLSEYPEGDAHYRWLLKESVAGILEWVGERPMLRGFDSDPTLRSEHDEYRDGLD